MKITDISVRTFTYTTREALDRDGHAHPSDPREAKMSLLTITDEEGDQGHCFGNVQNLRAHVLEWVRHMLVGEDATHRERLWQTLAESQRLSLGQFTDKALAVFDMALWDLAARKANLPLYKFIGAHRDKVPAYGSTMCGDELEGGLRTPEDYAAFAEKLVARGYRAIKLHTWNKPISWAPDARMDARACAAVREAVGPDITLMLDPYSCYSRVDALWLARQIEQLDYAWIEEPMNEASASSYQWLAANLTMPVLGPENMEGKFHTRAEWIRNGACDILRTGAYDVGGIGPALKTIHLAEAFGMECEVHQAGPGNLTLCAVQANGKWYERGLLHPMLDYDNPPQYLKSLVDPMDEEGFVHLSQLPGLGYDINFDHIDNNLCD